MDLVEQLREDARAESRASEAVARAKSARNQAAGDVGAFYDWMKPEGSSAWQAADEIERLRDALRPFAGESTNYDGDALDTLVLWAPTKEDGMERTTLRLGHLRRAAEVLKPAN